MEKFDNFLKTHSCEERYWGLGEDDRSNKSMSPQQRADWADKAKALKEIDERPAYKGEPCAPRNWRRIFRLLFPEAEVPSHGKTTPSLNDEKVG